jgi:leader peptidase (prepilin peptidase)/N-methyltransferase
MDVLFVFVFGAIIGSFVGALTWRWPEEKSIFDGRSICPHCKHQIRWYDNIPIFSYFILQGKCRDCKKKISKRYVSIEMLTAVSFVFFYQFFPQVSMNLIWLNKLPYLLGLSVFLSILSILIAVFIIDLEHQYIPDTLVFILSLLVFIVLMLSSNAGLFLYLTAGLGSAVFLLFIHLSTLGRGMGLGDVKLALAMGLVLGYPLAVVWMFSSFVLGSIIGIILIVLKAAKFKQRIAFGPFLVLGFLLAILRGTDILESLALL